MRSLLSIAYFAVMFQGILTGCTKVLEQDARHQLTTQEIIIIVGSILLLLIGFIVYLRHKCGTRNIKFAILNAEGAVNNSNEPNQVSEAQFNEIGSIDSSKETRSSDDSRESKRRKRRKVDRLSKQSIDEENAEPQQNPDEPIDI